MKRLIIIAEGDTEVEFVNKIVAPYLYEFELYDIRSYKIKHTKGGLTKYDHLRKDIINTIHERNVILTTLIDYYGLPEDFPHYGESTKIAAKHERLSFLETAIKEDIEKSLGRSFPNLIPYIQLHEFEALVLTSITGIREFFSEQEADFEKLDKLISSYASPEEINNNPTTAPSKRLKSLIPGYDKIVDGNNIISSNGIETVLEKCPRFKSWIENIIRLMKGE